MGMVILVLVLGGVVVWVGSVVGRPQPVMPQQPRRRPMGGPARAVSGTASVVDPQGIWARHPLEPEKGWCVAINGGVPVSVGARVDVKRKDGSRSLETVRRVLLELREPVT